MLDLSFDGDGMVTLSPLGDDTQIQAMAMQSDGKIVSAGLTLIYTPPNTHTYFALARLHPDGAVDTSFNGGQFYSQFDRGYDRAWGVKVQPDGKILVGGEIQTQNGYRDYGLARYNLNGMLDSTFGTQGWVVTDIVNFDDLPFGMALESNGNIVLGGMSTFGNNVFHASFTRYLSNGMPDPSFGTNGVSTITSLPQYHEMKAIAVLSDGRIVAAGTQFFQSTRDLAVMRLLANGDLDTTFSGDGINSLHFNNTNFNYFNCLLLQPDGKTVVAGSGSVNQTNTLLVGRLQANGDWDSTFGVNGIAAFPAIPTAAYGIGLQAYGKILVGGRGANAAPTTVHRLWPDGSLDSTYGVNGTGSCTLPAGTNQVRAALMQPDGKMLVGGKAQTKMSLARFLGDPLVAVAPALPSTPSFSLYPNPVIRASNSNIAVIFDQSVDGVVTFELLDLQGRIWQQEQVESKAGRSTHSLRLPAELGSGFYFFRMSANGERAVQKLVLY
ncbi:MAG: hypothetical protein RLZZ519_2814 [Bacteroidota bacterium]